MNAEFADDDLVRFDAQGGTPLPAADAEGWLDHDGARIWHASFGHGPPVVLLHGGLGHGGNSGNQMPALLTAGYRAIVIDSRGHGRSCRQTKKTALGSMGGKRTKKSTPHISVCEKCNVND